MILGAGQVQRGSTSISKITRGGSRIYSGVFYNGDNHDICIYAKILMSPYIVLLSMNESKGQNKYVPRCEREIQQSLARELTTISNDG